MLLLNEPVTHMGHPIPSQEKFLGQEKNGALA